MKEKVIIEKGGNSMRKVISFAMALLVGLMNLPAAFAASFPSLTVPNGVGVNIRFTGAPSTDLDMIRDAGIKYIRRDLHWHNVERSRGSYNWTPYDQLVDGAAARGIKVIYILAYNNTLYGASDIMYGIRTQEQKTAFANYAKAAAQRYRGKGVIFELWNEPNGTTFWKPVQNSTEYADFVKAVVPAIRQGDPNATIIAPALSWADPNWYGSVFSKGILSYVDAVSIHPYDKNQLPERWLNTYPYNHTKMRELIRQYNPNNPNMPIIASEWGYSVTHPFVNGSEQAQANYAARTQLINMSLGIPITVWFDFKNHDTGTAEESNYGLVRSNNAKKPSYLAMQSLTQALNGLQFVRRQSSSSSDYLMEFSNGSKTVVAAWTTGSTHNVTISGQSVSISGAPRYVQVAGGTPPPPPPTTTAPTAPSGLAVTSVTKGANTGSYYINLGWTDNSNNETGFEIQQSINSTSNFQTVATIAANTTTYASNIGATPNPGDFYYYRIVAANGTAKSQPSNVASTQMGTPNAPTNLAINQTTTSNGNYVVSLNWRDNSGIEAGYRIYQSNNATTGFQEVKTVGSNQTSTTIDLGTSPTPGTYYYRVTAYAAMGETSPTNTVNTQISSPVVPAPTAPSGLAVTSVTRGANTGNYYVNLGWTDNSNNETGFEIQQSINSTSNFQTVATIAANTTTYASNIGATPNPGDFYYYRVIAVNGTSKSQPSNTASTQISITNPPTAPGNLTSLVGKDISGNNAVVLNWQDNSSDEQGFNIYVSNLATSGFTKLATLAPNQNLVVHILNSLSGNTTLYYLIKAFNSGGESTPTNTTSVNVQ